jgi:hypothetical protein
MTRTQPECPVCAASVLRQSDGGVTTTWDIADRVEALRKRMEAGGQWGPKDGATMSIAAGCLRIAEFREKLEDGA